MNHIYRRLTLLILFLTTLSVQLMAHGESVDFMYSIGKIYVVVAVIVLLFLGIVLFLIRLDRKLYKLENQIRDESKTG